MIYEHVSEVGGYRVAEWAAGKTFDPAKEAVRVSVDYEEAEEGVAWGEKFAELLESPNAGEIEAFVVGPWGDVAAGDSSEPVVEALVSARDRLPKLKVLMFGDIVGEESEISWIQNGDFGPLLAAYPRLERFTVRGGMGLTFGQIRHAGLKVFIVETGGLTPAVIHEISSGDSPNLEHLELWLGEPNYGGDATVEDLSEILRGEKFPKLRVLGLRDSEISDDIAAALANAPIVRQLETLDLSLGTLGDAGAKALLGSGGFVKLKLLDIHHHFVSDELVAKLKGLGFEVDASDKQEPDEWGGESHRYIAHAE